MQFRPTRRLTQGHGQADDAAWTSTGSWTYCGRLTRRARSTCWWATQDIDLFVRPEAVNIAKVKAALRSVWDDPAIDEITADDLAGDYPTIRYGPPGETLVVDLIGRLGDAVRYDDLVAERKHVQGVTVSIATPATLYKMKRSTVRPIDRQDAAALRETFGLED